MQEVPTCVVWQAPFVMAVASTPQHTGVLVPAHSSGPSPILSTAGARASEVQPYVVVAPGIAQHAWESGQAVLPPHPKS